MCGLAQVTENRCAEGTLLVFLLSFGDWGLGSEICLLQTPCAVVWVQFSDLSNICPGSIQMLSFLFCREIADGGGEEP